MNRLPVLLLVGSWLPVAYAAGLYLSLFEKSGISLLLTIVLMAAIVVDRFIPKVILPVFLANAAVAGVYYLLSGQLTVFTEMAAGNLLAMPALLLYAMSEEKDMGISLVLYFLAYSAALVLASTVVLGARDPRSLLQTLATLMLALDIRSIGSYISRDASTIMPNVALLDQTLFTLLTLTGGLALLGYLLTKGSRESMSESHATTSVFLSCAAARRPAARPAAPTPAVTRKSRRLTRAPMCVPPLSP